MEVFKVNSVRVSDIDFQTTEEELNQRTDSFLLIADADDHEPSEGVTYSLHEATHTTVTRETATIIASPKVINGDGNSSVQDNPSSTEKLQVQSAVSDKNPLSVQSRTPPTPSSQLSSTSSLMMKRIVENQTILIWQAYDAWRLKFPRPEVNDLDEQINEIRTQNSEVQDQEHDNQGLESETESADLEMA